MISAAADFALIQNPVVSDSFTGNFALILHAWMFSYNMRSNSAKKVMLKIAIPSYLDCKRVKAKWYRICHWCTPGIILQDVFSFQPQRRCPQYFMLSYLTAKRTKFYLLQQSRIWSVFNHLGPDLQNILWQSYYNAEVTIILRRTSNLQTAYTEWKAFRR